MDGRSGHRTQKFQTAPGSRPEAPDRKGRRGIALDDAVDEEESRNRRRRVVLRSFHLDKGVAVARVFRRGDFCLYRQKPLASEEASYSSAINERIASPSRINN